MKLQTLSPGAVSAVMAPDCAVYRGHSAAGYQEGRSAGG